MDETSITITFDADMFALRSLSDQRLALLWHVAQANPADDHEGFEPGRVAEQIGREIIRRWLGGGQVELWSHQGQSYYWKIAQRCGSWPGPKHDTWAPNAGLEICERCGGKVHAIGQHLEKP